MEPSTYAKQVWMKAQIDPIHAESIFRNDTNSPMAMELSLIMQDKWHLVMHQGRFKWPLISSDFLRMPQDLFDDKSTLVQSGNGMVPSGNKPLPELMLTLIYVVMCMASPGHHELTHWGLVTPYLVNIGSGSGLLPHSTKPLPEPMFTYNWRSFAAFTGEQFQ